MSAKIIQPRNGPDNPAIAICEQCGNEFVMQCDDMGECECWKCSAVYNIFGQRLIGRTVPFSGMNEYGEYYDESY